VPVEDVRRFETEFLEFLHRNNEGLLTSIRETKDLPDDSIAALKDAMDRFRRTFEVTGGKLLVSDDDVATPLGADEVEQESVAKYNRPADPPASADSAAPDNLTGGE
jgi:F-type H+-transporting ATPase subunit alpha